MEPNGAKAAVAPLQGPGDSPAAAAPMTNNGADGAANSAEDGGAAAAGAPREGQAGGEQSQGRGTRTGTNEEGAAASDATTSSPPHTEQPQQQPQQGNGPATASAAAAAPQAQGGQPAAVKQELVPAAAADHQNIPVLPDVVRQKEAKRDLPMVCHIEGCGLDLSAQAEYYQRYRICKAHLKSPALLVDGMPQRFCQQCGRFHVLADFDGEKRNCRARLEQHNSRRRKVFVATQATRRSRYSSKQDKSGGGRGGGSRAEDDDEGQEEEEGAMQTDAAQRMPQYGSRGRSSSRHLAGTRRDRATMEADDTLKLTPQEKEAILLLRQAERPLGPGATGGSGGQVPQAALPQHPVSAPAQGIQRFFSEPARGLHSWRSGDGAAVREGGQVSVPEEELMLHSQLQDLLGGQQYLSRQEQIALAGVRGPARLGGGGSSAFTSISPQASLRNLLPSAYSSGLAGTEARLAELLGGNASAGEGLNAFASGGSAQGMVDQAGIFRTFTDPLGARNSQAPRGRGQPSPGNPQILAPTIPRDGLSGSRPRDAAELLRTLTAAATAQPQAASQQQQHQQQSQQQHQPPQQLPNPFLQQPGAAPQLPANQGLAGLGSVAALLAPGGSGGVPKASTLLRQMADLAATAELSMEQAALQQAAAAGARPLLDSFGGGGSGGSAAAPLALAAEELVRHMRGGSGGGSGSVQLAAVGGSGGSGSGSRQQFGGSGSVAVGGGVGGAGSGSVFSAAGAGGGGPGGGSGGPHVSATELLAALTALSQPGPLPPPPPMSQQQEQQQQPKPELRELPSSDSLALRQQSFDAGWGGQQAVARPQNQAANVAPQPSSAQEFGSGNVLNEGLLAALLAQAGGQSPLMQDIMSLLQGNAAQQGVAAQQEMQAARTSAGL